jgi:hypothetical protein
VFKHKCDNVYDLMVEYAMRVKKWAACGDEASRLLGLV